MKQPKPADPRKPQKTQLTSFDFIQFGCNSTLSFGFALFRDATTVLPTALAEAPRRARAARQGFGLEPRANHRPAGQRSARRSLCWRGHSSKHSRITCGACVSARPDSPPLLVKRRAARVRVPHSPRPWWRDVARNKSECRRKEHHWIRAVSGVEPMHHGVNAGDHLRRSERAM